MGILKTFCIFGTIIGASFAQDCWVTGCQPNNWGVVGCSQYGREEKGKEPCTAENGVGGFKYNCCEVRESGGGSGDSNNDLNISFNQFSEAVTSNEYPAPSLEKFNQFVNNAKTFGKISTMEEAAMALAQFIHESDGLRAKREYACEMSNCPGSYRSPKCDAPNQYYFGRGYIQLTWCGNYRDASQHIFGDDRLVKEPELVAESEELAWKTALWYWGSRVHGKPGIAEGKFGASTRIINGLECGGSGHSGPAKRYRFYGNVRSAFGLDGPGDAAGC